MPLLEPFGVALDFATGVLDPEKKLIERRLSHMRGMYANPDAEARLLSADDPVVYRVYACDLPEETGQVLYCTTVIYPGQVGDEYFMTKGHFHALRDRGEVYFGLAGEGYLLLYAETGEARAVAMQRGTVAYVPPHWAHRTVNTGQNPFIFFAAWPGDAGHDYASIESSGFPELLVAQGGKPTLVDNSRFSLA